MTMSVLWKCGNEAVNLVLYEWKLVLTIGTVFALYFYYTATFDHFKKKGISYIRPSLFVGTLGPRIIGTKSLQDHQMEIYSYFKGKRFGGTFNGRTPVLVIIDTDLVKAIMIRDFDHFTDRHIYISTEPRYLSRSVLTLKGTDWKIVRSIIAPVYSSSRLKNIFPLLKLCTKQMVEYLKQYDGTDLEMKETAARYTLEAIGACAFGIKCDALSHNKTTFIEIAEKLDYIPKAKFIAISAALLLAPGLINILKTKTINIEAADKLLSILQAAKEERRLVHSDKKDFLQLLVDIANKEKTVFGKTLKKEMDDATIDAQCLFFLIAGYETSSTMLSFALHALATAPRLQQRLREHVCDVTRGKDMSYELLAELTYLEAFLLETLRMYPPVGLVNRVVTKPYQIPGSSVELAVGDVVAIPIYCIHMDPEYYPEPTVFRPERFMGDEKKNRPSHLFLGFGAGPRACLGLRFVLMSAKVAMVSLLKNFTFSTCPKTEHPVKFDKLAQMLKSRTGLWVRVETLRK